MSSSARREATVQVARAARALARTGLVHAFGHVSIRVGAYVVITPTAPPLSEVAPEDVLSVPVGRAGEHERLPLEHPLHLAIYRARSDVGAICRVHGEAIAAWSVVGVPPLLHGFGGMVEPVAWWDDPALITSGAAKEVAARLGDAPAMLLRGNGAVVVGRSLTQAMARAWALEDRCRVALMAGGAGRPLTTDELRRRSAWYPAEEERIARWLLVTGERG